VEWNSKIKWIFKWLKFKSWRFNWNKKYKSISFSNKSNIFNDEKLRQWKYEL
jgi:hypothetical protein